MMMLVNMHIFPAARSYSTFLMLTNYSCFYQSVSIDEFLKPAKVDSSQQATERANGDRFQPPAGGRKEHVGNVNSRGGGGQGFQGRGRGGYRGGNSSQQATERASGDRFQQPAGGRKEHVGNVNSRGGGGQGGFPRGSSADPTVVDAPIKPPVPVPAFDDSAQFPHLGAPAVK